MATARPLPASTRPTALEIRSRLAPFAAEALGTFALVFMGPGSAGVNAASGGAVSVVGVGICFGLVIMVMICALGSISGCHMNPAVTAAMLLRRQIQPAKAAGYVAAQLLGGTLAALAVVAMLGGLADAMATVPSINGTGAAFASELTLTFLLVSVIFAAAGFVSSHAGQPRAGTIERGVNPGGPPLPKSLPV